VTFPFGAAEGVSSNSNDNCGSSGTDDVCGLAMGTADADGGGGDGAGVIDGRAGGGATGITTGGVAATRVAAGGRLAGAATTGGVGVSIVSVSAVRRLRTTFARGFSATEIFASRAYFAEKSV